MNKKFIPLIYTGLACIAALTNTLSTLRWNNSASTYNTAAPLTVGVNLIIFSLIFCTGIILYQLSQIHPIFVWKTKKLVLFIVCLLGSYLSIGSFAMLLLFLSGETTYSHFMISMVVNITYLFKIVLSCAFTLMFTTHQENKAPEQAEPQ